MRDSSSLLPTSSVEMKTDQFSSYGNYAKAGLIFAATTATYFLAKTTGMLPNWFWGGETSSHSETMDTALTMPKTSSLVIEEIQPEVAVFSMQSELAESSRGFVSGVTEPSLIDFQEADLPSLLFVDSVNEDKAGESQSMTTDEQSAKEAESVTEDEIIIDTSLLKSNRRRLLQQTSDVTVVNPIPNKVIDINQLYTYPLDNVFSGNYSLLTAAETGKSSLPDWLSLQYAQLGYYSMPGVASLLVSGITLYVMDRGNTLQILDVSTPSIPRLLGRYSPTGSSYGDLAISGTTLYMATESYGLVILNVSIPSTPLQIGSYTQGSDAAYGVAVLDMIAYVTFKNDGLIILNVSEPSTPLLLGNYPASQAVGVAISNTTLFVGDFYTGLLILDVSTPSVPRLLNSYSGSASQLAVSGTTVVAIIEGSLLIIADVSVPNAPLWRSMSFPPLFIDNVAILDKFVFVATDSGGLLVLDVNTSTPQLVGKYSKDSIRPFDVAVSDKTLFIGDFNAGLSIVNLSQGQLTGIPPLVSAGQKITITVGACNFTTVLADTTFTLILDQLPYHLDTVVSDQSVFPNHTLSLLLSSSSLFVNPSNSFLSLSLQTQNGQALPRWCQLTSVPFAIGGYSADGYASDVVVLGTTMFVGSPNELDIVDVSIPNIPRLLSSFSLGVNPYCMAASAGTVFTNFNGGLLILNVSAPSTPNLLGSYPSQFFDIAISGTTVYIPDTLGRLLLLDVGTPNMPRLLGNYSAGSGIIGPVAVLGSIAYVGGGGLGFQILDVSMPSAPRLLGSYPVHEAESIAVLDTTAYVLDYPIGLLILDVSILSTPRLLGGYYLANLIAAFAVKGTTVFIVTPLRLLILDVSTSSTPRLLGSYPISGASGGPFGLAVSGEIVFLAENNAGVQILDVSQWALTAGPAVTDVGNYPMQLTATDVLGGTASTTFTIRVEGPPQINGTITQRYAKVGQAFNYFVPQGLITDPNFDPISFTAVVKGSPSFPAWLSFNGVSAIFVGVPQDGDVGNFTMILSATDNIPGTAVLDTTFGLLVDHLPVVTQSIPAQVAGIGMFYNYTPPDTLFYEPDGYPMSYSAQQSNRLPLPLWLTFNTTSRLFSGRPNSTDAGSYSIAVTAQDNYQGQAKADFVLVVENFPVINQKIVAPLAGVGVLFNWVVPFNAFIDLDNEPLTYTADQQDSSNLPNWLTFNPQTLTFFGEPLSSDVRTLSLRLNATDPSGGRAQQTFNLTVSYFPEVKGTIPDQLADIDQLYEYTVASDVFSQEDHTVLIYSVNQSSGALPDWLSFNSTSRQLKGTPNITAWGDYDLQMVATNVWGAQASIDFPLVVEHFPVVNQWIQPPLAGVDVAFNWVIPTNAFMDLDNDLSTYTAHQQDGSLLPNWLGFNSRALVFSGVPQATDVAVLPLTLSVTDSKGAQAQQSFNLTVTYFPRLGITSIPSQLSNIDAPYLYTIPPSVFAEDEPLVLTYAARQSSGLALPDWLQFNATTLQLSGQPNVTAAGIYDLEVIATNPAGASISASFSLQVEHFPEVVRSIISPLADISSVFSFSVPADSFIDRDGDPLTYSAQRENTASLPIWLTFNPQSLSFSGVPLETDEGDLPLQLTATDSAGASVTTNLTIQVIHFPVLAHPASTMTFRAGQFFNFSLPPDTFTDQDQVGLSYSIQQPLPDWLAFKNQTLSFSGTTTSGNIGMVSLILMATDTRGASTDMSFQIVARANVPPVVLEAALSNQAATVGQVFSYFLPVPLFVDAYNNTLTYSALQQDNSPLPGWLSFDNQSLHFSGTPGHGDTNFYATRTVGMKISAQSDEGQTGINFNIIVDGLSWGQLAVNIGAPVVSILTTLFALYEARALLLNRCRREKHARKTITRQVGEDFQYKFQVKADSKDVDSAERIYQVQVGIHDSTRRCYEFSKPTYRLLPGNNPLPWWMEYDADQNLLYSKPGGIPSSSLKHDRLELQAEDEDGIILDKIILNIMPAVTLEKKREEKHEDQEDKRNTQKIKSTATVAEEGDIELTTYNEPEAPSPTTATAFLMGSKKPSEKDLQESKKDSPPISTRRKKVPSATNLIAPDSPLRQGTRTTSSMIEGDSRKKQTGKETSEPQVDRQSRSCC